MEVQKEAQRIMTLSVWKMYHSRVQRGGMRLHRSLQLSLVMRSARELYLSARLEDDEESDENCAPAPTTEAPTGASPVPEESHACAIIAPAPLQRREDDAQPEAVARREEATCVLPEATESEERACADLQDEVEQEAVPPEPMEEEEDSVPAAPLRAARPSRKRRSCTLSRRGAAEEAELVPLKKARLGDSREAAPPQPQEGAFPSLAKVLQSGIGAVLGAAPPGSCRGGGGGGGFSIVVRAVVAF